MTIEKDLKALGLEEPEYLQPCRQTIVRSFLCDAPMNEWEILHGYEWYTKKYNPAVWDLVVDETFRSGPILLHGHKSDHPCSAPCFCHIYGYWPGKEFNPRFIKQFRLKWEPIYKERGWEIG